jgi:aldehyde dehydrogenase (NAD+)
MQQTLSNAAAVPSSAVRPSVGDASNALPSRYISESVQALRSYFEAGHTRSYEWRIQQLDGLTRMIAENEARIIETLVADVGKTSEDAWTAEIMDLNHSIAYLRKNLRRFMKPEKVATPLHLQPGSSRVVREPLGVVLVISAWNYPFSLAVSPAAGALAAGNCVLVKPSEVAARTSALLAELLPKYLDKDAVRVVEGGVPETTEVLQQRFDHILYTGSTPVGRIVMAAAAKHLTPVTLELGGKSPCIIDEQVDLDVAARRLVWGKFYTTGQTCIAPDYVLCHSAVHDAFLARLVEVIREFWGDDPKTHPDYGRIVNARHHRRLMALLPGSGEVVAGGAADENDRYIAPTVLKNVPPDSKVMGEEIFGPILPVLKVDSVEQAIRFINERPKPLSLYLFSSNEQSARAVMERTSSGAFVRNHSVLHYTVSELPFGGVGESGMGAYHGRWSFDTFSHRKAVLQKTTAVDLQLQYPPYTESKKSWLRRILT